jgi:hypothetical protein
MDTMDKKKSTIPSLNIISIILFLCSAIIMILIACIEAVISILVVFFLLSALFFAGMWICTSKSSKQHKSDMFHLFCITLLINIVVMVGTSYLFQHEIGVLYGANDEAKIYYEGDIEGRTVNTQLAFIKNIPYPLYLYILTFLSSIANTLGGNSPFVFKLVSVFFGACVPVVIYAHFVKKFTIKKAKKTALFSGLFPGFLYFSALGVRDIIVILLTILFFFLLLKKDHKVKRTILLLLVVYLISLLRLEHAAFILATYLSYHVIQILRRLDFLKIVVLMVYSVMLLGGIVTLQNVLFDFVQDQIIEQKEFYMRLFIESALKKNTLESSLTFKIRNMPVPANYIVMFGYNVLNNFPPHLLLQSPDLNRDTFGKGRRLIRVAAGVPVSTGRILKVLGPFVWYFILPYILLGFFFRKKYLHFNFDDKLSAFYCFLYIFAISIFTTDIGRIVTVYGYLVPFGLLTRYQTPVQMRRKIDVFTFFAVGLLFIVYFTIKSAI